MLRLDVHPKLTPNGAALYTDLPALQGTKKVTVQHLANGSGEFAISRHSDAATAAIIDRGNWVKCYLTELSTTVPFFTFQLENGDFDVISGDEEGGEILTFGGPGNRSYLKNAIIWLDNFMGQNPIHHTRPDSWHWFNDQYGDILKRFMDEDAARPTPTMPALTYDWTSSDDSRGTGHPWPSFSGNFWLDIGLSYEEALDLMQDYGDLFVRMNPNFLMQAYAEEYGIDRSSATFASGKVRFVKGVNIKGDLEKNIYGPVRYTHVIVQGGADSDGNPVFVEVVDPNYVVGQERREGFLRHGETNSIPQLQGAGLKLIREGEKNENAIAWTGTVNGNTPLQGKYIPGPAAIGGHFFEGDYITLDTGGDELGYNNQKIQVMSLTYVELENGEVDYIIEADGSITAGSSGLGGELDGDPCCGKPGSGVGGPVLTAPQDPGDEPELIYAWDDNNELPACSDGSPTVWPSEGQKDENGFVSWGLSGLHAISPQFQIMSGVLQFAGEWLSAQGWGVAVYVDFHGPGAPYESIQLVNGWTAGEVSTFSKVVNTPAGATCWSLSGEGAGGIKIGQIYIAGSAPSDGDPGVAIGNPGEGHGGTGGVVVRAGAVIEHPFLTTTEPQHTAESVLLADGPENWDATNLEELAAEIATAIAAGGGVEVRAITVVIDGMGGAIEAGQTEGVVDLPVPFDLTLVGWTIVAMDVGSIQVDIWKDTYANFPPTDADSICAGHEPALVGGQKAQDLDLSDWSDTAVEAGSVLRFYIDSAAAVTRMTLSLSYVRGIA